MIQSFSYLLVDVIISHYDGKEHLHVCIVSANDFLTFLWNEQSTHIFDNVFFRSIWAQHVTNDSRWWMSLFDDSFPAPGLCMIIQSQ